MNITKLGKLCCVAYLLTASLSFSRPAAPVSDLFVESDNSSRENFHLSAFQDPRLSDPAFHSSRNLAKANPKSEPATAGNRIVIIDAAVEDANTLLAGIDPLAQVFYLGGNVDGVKQISQILSQSENVSELHIISHGTNGAISLGTSRMDAANLSHYANQLNSWDSALADGADILLYGCDVGADESGHEFINRIANLTNADVAASNDNTGAVDLVADWELEVTTGGIEAQVIVSLEAQQNYSWILPTVDGSGSVDGNQTYTEADNGDGITTIVHFADDVPGVPNSLASITDGAGFGGSSGNLYLSGTIDNTQTVTVTFSSAVTVASFQYIEADAAASGTYTFTPVGGGSTILVPAGAFTIPGDGTLVSPVDWTGITGFVVTNSNGAFTPGLDTIDYNVAPTLTGLVSDITVTEDIASDVDLSAANFESADSDDITVTLTVDAGTFSAPADGAGIGAGVTETLVNSSRITLIGNADDIDTYLDTASNIQYTGAEDVAGNDVATLTVAATDGTDAIANQNANIDITAVNDSPTDISLSASSIIRSLTVSGADIGSLGVSDIDGAGPTFSLVADGSSANGSCGGIANDDDNGSFQINSITLETVSALLAGNYEICLQAHDGGTTFQKNFTIMVTDNIAPTITAVSIPNAPINVGDTVTATISVNSDNDDYTSGSGAITGNINGYSLGTLNRNDNTTYTAIFTVVDGGTDVAAGADIPVNFTLSDSNGNTSSAFTTPISQPGDAFFANAPPVPIPPDFELISFGESTMVVAIGSVGIQEIIGGQGTYSVISTNPSIANISIADNKLLIVPVSEGTTRVFVHESFRSVGSFTLRIIEENSVEEEFLADSLPTLDSINNDGSDTLAIIQGGASANSRVTFFNDATYSTAEKIEIVALITPEEKHIGEQVQIIVGIISLIDPNNFSYLMLMAIWYFLKAVS
ncbi:MAG: DUF4347 domain-containing protein [Pseudomonadales bacterium]|nr:DUF4347 domain-containing protein [Pseudomonadales bacterium]